MRCLGISRELQNSPNRETDDARILSVVLEQLELLNLETVLMSPEETDRAELAGWDLILPMCEAYPRLVRLKRLAEAGALIVNPPDSVLSCYRTEMLKAFANTPGLRFPETKITATAKTKKTAPAAFPAPAFAGAGAWIKRGDVHNTCNRDVVFARTPEEIEAVRADFERREITAMVLQRHVEGDLVKFYGVGPGQWFTWFYHAPANARRLAFQPEDLATSGELAARAVGLEIFGGDAIVSPDGFLSVIDINSWPSFARVRAEAGVQIARHLGARLRQALRPKAP